MIKSYNYSHLITDKDQKDAIKLVDHLIKSGNWDKSKPRFQTFANLYTYREFSIFRKTFIESCIKYLGEQVDYEMKMWCYRDNRFENMKKIQNLHWHSHDEGYKNRISGIYYLRNLRSEGTQFIDGIIETSPFTWYLYPSHLLHKPPKIKCFRNRYTIAADFSPKNFNFSYS